MSECNSYLITRVQYLSDRLRDIGESDYVEEVFHLHGLYKYCEASHDVLDTVGDILEGKLNEIEEQDDDRYEETTRRINRDRY